MSVVEAAMHRVSGDVEVSRVLPESAVITLPQQHCVGTPQSSYDSVRTISWTFAIDVDGLFAADQQFRTMISQLQTSAQDANDARHLIELQLASCVPHAAEDLKKLENSALDTVKLLELLRVAISTYAWAVRKVRDNFRSIREDARKAGLTVSECGESAFIHLSEQQRDSYSALFSSLSERCSWTKNNLESANYQFATDLSEIDTSCVERILGSLVKRFRDKFLPPQGYHAEWKMPKYLQGLVNDGIKTFHGAYLFNKNAIFSPTEDYVHLNSWRRFIERGKLSNWKPTRGRHVHQARHGPKVPEGAKPGRLAQNSGEVTQAIRVDGEASSVLKNVSKLESGAKLLGGGVAIAGGGLSALESYQSDTYHHPGMGEGTKIARAGIKGIATAGFGYAGATYGAQIGAALGAPLGPLGIVAGGLIGGVLGGWMGSSAGDTLATLFNDKALAS